jgi:hypothetical protein
MAELALVHGSTQSPRGFDGLVAALQRRNHRAVSLEISGPASDGADQHAQRLAAQVPTDVEHPVVLAHSAAGLLLPALAHRLGAVHQLWLAAAVPDYQGRRSILEELRATPHAMFNPEWIGVDPSRDPVLATYFLFHDADLAGLRSALQTVTTTDLAGVYAETPCFDPARVPSTYILPTQDRTIRPDWMAYMARNRLGVEPVIVLGGHCPYASAPDEIAEIIHRAVNERP